MRIKSLITLAMFLSAVLLASGCPASTKNSVAGNPSATPAASHAGTGEKPKAADPSPSSEPAKSPSPKDESSDSAKDKPETRCGWFANPTPANAWIDDADGEWIVSVQGGYQAEGDWPDFPDDKWVKTNGYYGYGCACMKVTVDKKQHRIIKIFSATAKPLADCRRDKALVEPSE